MCREVKAVSAAKGLAVVIRLQNYKSKAFRRVHDLGKPTLTMLVTLL